jgi:hypothetical protein
MKFKVKRDPIIVGFYGLILVLYLLAFIVSITTIFSGQYENFTEGFLDYLVVGASPFIVYLLSNNIINIQYEIVNSEKILKIRSGFIRDKIKLRDIKQVEAVTSWFPQGTMARDKIKVYLQRPGMQTSYFHVGVANENEFIDALKKYVPDLIVITKQMRLQINAKEKEKKQTKK